MNFASNAEDFVTTLNSQIEILRADSEPKIAKALALFMIRPTLEEIAPILDECFWASLEKDEGRPTRFSLALMPDELQAQTASAFVSLAEPLPVNRKTIRRLAPVAPPEDSILCVQRRNGALRVTGVMSFSEHYGRPVAITLTATSPGKLSISFNNRRLMAIDHGAVTMLRPLPFDERGVVNLLSTHQRGDREADLLRNDLVGETLFQAARFVRQAGHGGSFWLLAPGSEFEGSLTAVSNSGDLFAPLLEAEARERARVNSMQIAPSVRVGLAEDALQSSEMRGVARCLANLAVTDGAVLLTMAPRLVGFGAFCHSRPPEQGVADVISTSTDFQMTRELGGGRHKAAAAFCAAGAHGERAAIVTSQDGETSLFLSVRTVMPPAIWLENGVARIRVAPVGRSRLFP